MKILAVDTATTSCSVAVVDHTSICAELTTRKKQTHSKHLMTSIDSVLTSAGFRAGDLDGLAVTIGPGSFTGLRIGIATIKGIASALDKPVVGLSSLEVLARQCTDRSRLICPLLDARKTEIYGATYRFNEDRLIQQTAACAVKPEAFVRQIQEPCVFIGDGARLYREKIQNALAGNAYFVSGEQNIIRASTIALLSLKKFRTKDTVRVADLIPLYIRKSDAELCIAANSGVHPPAR